MAAGPCPAAIELLSDDRVWPYLLLADESLAKHLAAEGLVPRALAAGRDAALQVRQSYPSAGARDVVASLGIPVVHSTEESLVSWRYPRSSYQQRPPQIQVFVRAIPLLAELAHTSGLLPRPASAGLPAEGVRPASAGLLDESPEDSLLDLLLAHELYHHLALTSLGRASARFRLRRRILGRLGRWVEVPVLDEIAAHSFVREFCRLRVSPAILDLLTVHRSPERLAALERRARVLRDYAA